MGEFATTSKRHPQSRPGQPIPNPPLMNRGLLPPSTVNKEHVPTRAIGLHDLHIGLSDFVFDTTAYTYDGKAQDSITGQWNRVGSAGQIKALIGPISDPVVLTVWGSFAWKNGGADPAGMTRAIFGLYEDPTTVLPSIWGDNEVLDYLPADGKYHAYNLFGRFIIPVTDGADWHVGMLHQYNSGGTRSTQIIRAQSLMTLVSAYNPDADSATSTDPAATDAT